MRRDREYLLDISGALNIHCGFGRWQWSVSRDPADLPDILKKAIHVDTDE